MRLQLVQDLVCGCVGLDVVHVAASLQTAIANRLVLIAAAHSMEDNSVSSAVHRLAATHTTPNQQDYKQSPAEAAASMGRQHSSTS